MKKILNKTIYNINFKGNVGSEINKIHLGLIFTMPGLKNMVFCIPMTSPKEKHFKTIDDFNNRNGRELRFFSWYYLKQTDSILKLDQMKTISNLRLISKYKRKGVIQTINNIDHLKIQNKLTKYIKDILK